MAYIALFHPDGQLELAEGVELGYALGLRGFAGGGLFGCVAVGGLADGRLSIGDGVAGAGDEVEDGYIDAGFVFEVGSNVGYAGW